MAELVSKKVVAKDPPPGFPWQRLLLSILGIMILMTEWRWAVNHIYALQQTPAALTAFTSITNNNMYAIVVLVVFFVTGQVFFNWTNATTSTITQEAKSLIEEHIPKSKHFDDPPIS